jgi:hypothetical protein
VYSKKALVTHQTPSVFGRYRSANELRANVAVEEGCEGKTAFFCVPVEDWPEGFTAIRVGDAPVLGHVDDGYREADAHRVEIYLRRMKIC